MTRDEWIKYHDRQAEKHGETEKYKEKNCSEVFGENEGIFQYEVNGEEMTMLECIGHFSFWNDHIPWLAKKLGCNKIIAYSNTNKPKRLERLYKAKVVSHIDGIYKFVREV